MIAKPNIRSKKRIKAVTAWYFLWRTAKEVENYALGSISSTGLCLSDFAVLESLLHRGPLSLSQLRERIMVSSGSTTAAIDRLEREGLVTREASSEDRRLRLVHLTPAGKDLIENHFASHSRDMEKMFTSINDEELTSLVSILRKISQAATEGQPPVNPGET